MKSLLIYLFFLLVAILGGLAIKAHGGYVLIAYQKWTIEIPLWFFIVALLASFFTLHYLLRFLAALGKSCTKCDLWLKHHRIHKANAITEKGLSLLLNGSWKKAEKAFKNGMQNSSIESINYLGAAYCAHKLKDDFKQDEYLYKAYKIISNDAVNLAKAHMLLADKETEAALPLLLSLSKQQPKNHIVLSLLQKLYLQTENWHELMTLLPRIKKFSCSNSENLFAFSVEVYSHVLQQTDHDSLTKTWNNIPSEFRKENSLIFIYVKALQKFKNPEAAASLIETSIKKEWNSDLVKLYGLIQTSHPEKQLKKAETWLKEHHQDAGLYLTLGRLSAAFKCWNKAKDYLTESLKIEKSAEAEIELAQVYEQLGNINQALKTYRAAIAIKTN